MVLLFAIILGILPGFAWLIFFLQEDPKPEPKRLVVSVFLMGALITFIAIGVEGAYADLFEYKPSSLQKINLFGNTLSGGGTLILLFFGLAAIEEILKFSAAYLSIHKSPYFDEAIDAMIYMIVAGLGFATAENILFAIGGIQEGLAASIIYQDLISGVVETTTLRFIGATLLHGLGSGIIGYYWALGIVIGREKHFIFRGLIIATILHTIFNYLIIKYGSVQVIYPSLMLLVAAIVILYDFEKIKGFPRKKLNN